MSIEALNWALHVPVGGNRKVILLGLANHAHPNGTETYPSLNTLAVYAHCDRSTARRNVRWLVKNGWAIPDGKGPKGQEKFRLPLDRVGGGEMPPQAVSGLAEARDGKTPPGGKTPPVAAAPAGGGISYPPPVAPVPPEPSIEPSVNQEGAARTDSAQKKVPLPDGFPDDLKPHLKAVFRILRDFATRHDAKAINPTSLAHAVMANPDRHYITEAHNYASNWETKDPKDVVAGYRRWLSKAERMAAPERVDADGNPLALPLGVTPMRRGGPAGAQRRENTGDLSRFEGRGA